MDILISNLLSKSILDFGKWPNRKYANTRVTDKYYLNFFLTSSASSPLLFERVSNKITKLGSIWEIQIVAFSGQ